MTADRSKPPPVRTGRSKFPHGYFDEAVPKLYAELREHYLWDPFEQKYVDLGAFPEKELLAHLFDLFLKHHGEETVRKIFAEFGPKAPRKASVDRERLILKAYLKEGLPPKIQFARSIVDHNKTVPRQKRLGSRSTSEINTVMLFARRFPPPRNVDEATENFCIRGFCRRRSDHR
jgi:hypothetical protein